MRNPPQGYWIATALLLMLSGSKHGTAQDPVSATATPTPTLPLRHESDGGRLNLSIRELGSLQIGDGFKYVGGQRFILREVADAEQHFYVVADSAGRVERLYWIQIEELLPNRPGGYDYSADPPVQLDGLTLASNLRTYTGPSDPGSDRDRGLGYLKARGYTVAEEATRLRLVYLPETPARREIMIIYVETDPEARRDSREALLARAREGLTLRTSRSKASAP